MFCRRVFEPARAFARVPAQPGCHAMVHRPLRQAVQPGFGRGRHKPFDRGIDSRRCSPQRARYGSVCTTLVRTCGQRDRCVWGIPPFVCGEIPFCFPMWHNWTSSCRCVRCVRCCSCGRFPFGERFIWLQARGLPCTRDKTPQLRSKRSTARGSPLHSAPCLRCSRVDARWIRHPVPIRVFHPYRSARPRPTCPGQAEARHRSTFVQLVGSRFCQKRGSPTFTRRR